MEETPKKVEIPKNEETPKNGETPDNKELKNNDIEETGQKKKKKKWIIILLILILIGLAGGFYVWYTNRNTMDKETKYWFDKTAKDGTLEGKTPEEVQGMLDDIVEQGKFNVSMNVEPVFEDGSSEGSLGIENVEENIYYCRVVLTLDEDGTKLLETDGLKPGQYIDKVKLDQTLPKGQYKSTAEFIITDPESLEDIGKVNVKVLITILN